MEKENDFRMKEELDVHDICAKLLQIGVNQRDIDYLDHQIFFLREQFTKMEGYQLSIRQLMTVFNLSEAPIRRAIKAGLKLPEEAGRHPSLKKEIEENLVQMIHQREKDENPILPCEFRKFVNETYKEKLTTGLVPTFLVRYIDDIQKAKSFPLYDYRCAVQQNI